MAQMSDNVLQAWDKRKLNKQVKVAISGYFDPIHIGHLDLIYMARRLSENTKLIVILNNDNQIILKKGRAFMPIEERKRILESIKGVDEVIISIDNDRTVCETLKMILPDIFANGGDRHIDEIPESKICEEYDIKMVDGLGNKIQSSSNLTGLK